MHAHVEAHVCARSLEGTGRIQGTDIYRMQEDVGDVRKVMQDEGQQKGPVLHVGAQRHGGDR